MCSFFLIVVADIIGDSQNKTTGSATIRRQRRPSKNTYVSYLDKHRLSRPAVTTPQTASKSVNLLTMREATLFSSSAIGLSSLEPKQD